MADMPIVFTLVSVFLSVALLSGSLSYLALEGMSPVRRRVRGLGRTTSARATTVTAFETTALDDPLVKRIATFVPRSRREIGRIRKRLMLAGMSTPGYLAAYLIAEVALPVSVFGTVLVLAGWDRVVFAGLGAVIAFMLPGFVVDRWRKRRQREIEEGLPDALDLLIVSIEAGLGVDQSLQRCADELRIAYPALADELHLINVECRAGKPRIEAFTNFAERTQVEDVRALVAMLVQTDRFGTSIVQALRTYAGVSRTKRRQRAEERASKISVKLIFPLVFCLFPAFFIVILGSAYIKFVRVFEGGSPLGGGLP